LVLRGLFVSNLGVVRQVGITDGFVRISVGLEDVDDLLAALAKVLDTL